MLAICMSSREKWMDGWEKGLLTTGRNNITGGILSDGVGIIGSARKN